MIDNNSAQENNGLHQVRGVPQTRPYCRRIRQSGMHKQIAHIGSAFARVAKTLANAEDAESPTDPTGTC
jgi:hypothetical protein